MSVGCSLWPATLSSLLEWKLGEAPLPFTLSPEAATLLFAFESECLATPDAGAPGTGHHFADHAYRLTLLLQLADHAGYCADPTSPEGRPWTEVIPATAAARAIALLRWYQQHQQPILETLHQQPDPDLKKITAWLTRAGGQLTLNHLRQHHNFVPDRIESLVDAYPHLLRLDDDTKTTPGRKSQFVTLISMQRSSSLSCSCSCSPSASSQDASPNSPQSPESPHAQVGAAFLPPTSESTTSDPNSTSAQSSTTPDKSPSPLSTNSPQSESTPVHSVHQSSPDISITPTDTPKSTSPISPKS